MIFIVSVLTLCLISLSSSPKNFANGHAPDKFSSLSRISHNSFSSSFHTNAITTTNPCFQSTQNLLINNDPGFETLALGSTNFWTCTVTGQSTASIDTTMPASGTRDLKLTSSINGQVDCALTLTGLTANVAYTWNARMLLSTTATINMVQVNGVATTFTATQAPNSVYTLLSSPIEIFTGNSVTLQFVMYSQNTAQVNIDDLSLTLATATCLTATPTATPTTVTATTVTPTTAAVVATTAKATQVTATTQAATQVVATTKLPTTAANPTTAMTSTGVHVITASAAATVAANAVTANNANNPTGIQAFMQNDFVTFISLCVIGGAAVLVFLCFIIGYIFRKRNNATKNERTLQNIQMQQGV